MHNTIDNNEAFLYEIGSCNFVMSFIYKWFPKYFNWVCMRKYKRYISFLSNFIGKPSGIDVTELINEIKYYQNEIGKN